MKKSKEVWYFFNAKDKIANICNFGLPCTKEEMSGLIKLFEDKYYYSPESEAPSWVLNVAKPELKDGLDEFEKTFKEIVRQLQIKVAK